MARETILMLFTMVVLVLSGCDSAAPAPAPIEKKISEQAAKTQKASEFVSGSLSIDGVTPDGSTPLKFTKEQTVRISISARFADSTTDKTSVVIKCQRPHLLNGLQTNLVGANSACSIPVQDLEFTMPVHAGEWNLVVMDHKLGIVCQTPIVVQ
jgi:predicted component of type VI protein secretion system